jgi:hypothetical protein
MRTAEGILEEYRKGDFYRRLNLYLQYRDLRCQLTQIDSDERASPQAAVSDKKESKILQSPARSWEEKTKPSLV